MASARTWEPQSWNRYTYSFNNPLKYVDPNGMDVPKECIDNSDCRITIKVKVPRWKDEATKTIPEVPSVTSIWAIADWHERECYDLVGVNFTDHPNLRRILCPEDWEGHPLRKDYEMPLEYHGVRGK